MDKYEYKVRADEIKRLIGEGDYAQAADIADTIDWRRVKSVMMLCTVSDLYKINRRYEDAKNMLLLAYERRPGGRTICYSLCELCIKTEDFLQAVNYYKEFVQTAPKDPGRYILQYKIYEAQDVSLEERIGVLEELKKRDYREKWAYELAYLYHRVGLATRCVEECDELILWFGSGKYVIKAMELKMLHEPLTAAQQEVYDHRFDVYEQEEGGYESEAGENYTSDSEEGENGEEKGQHAPQGEAQAPGEDYGQPGYWEYAGAESRSQGEFEEREAVSEEPDEMDIQVKTMDVGKFNTINLQEELAAGLQEVLGTDYGYKAEDGTGEDDPSRYGGDPENSREPEDMPESIREDMPEETPESEEEVEVFFGETGEIRNPSEEVLPEAAFGETEKEPEEPEAAAGKISQEEGKAAEQAAEPEESGVTEAPRREKTGDVVMRQMREEAAGEERGKEESRKTGPVQPPAELAGVLSQEANGQIRLVMPESAAVEKQITGQMKIEDILAEWERMKKESQEKGREEVRRHVLQQTGPMFTEFEAAVRDGLLEQLETGENIGAERQEETGTPEEFSDGAQSGEAAEPEEAGEFREPEETEEERADYPGQEEALSEPEDVRDLEEQDFEEEFTDFGESDGYFTVDEDDLPAGGLPEDEAPDTFSRGDAEDPENFEQEEYPEDSENFEQEEYPEDSEQEEYLEDPENPEQEEYPEDPEEEEYPEDSGEEEKDYEAEPEKDFWAAEEPEEESAGSETPAGYTPISEGEDDFVSEEPSTEDAFVSGEPESENKADDGIASGPEQKAGKKKIRKTLKAGGGKKKAGDSKTKEEDTAAEAPTAAETEEEKEERQPIERDRAKIRALTREEKELYAPFIQSRRSREQLVKAIDNISMAAYTGNVVITGEEGMDTLTLAKNMIREVQMADSNFSGKAAKISGQDLNKRDVRKTLEEMNGGALIIYTASGMNTDTAKALYRSLQQERLGIIVVLEDTKKAIQKLFLGTPELTGAFTAKMDVEALSNDTLVLFGKRYAREMEYSIDDLGILALHTRIEELQTIDHVVTVVDVKKIVDDAIRHASRKTLGHFFDILFARRYDDEDMIILTEKDFVA